MSSNKPASDLEQLSEFASLATEFCIWAESDPQSEELEVLTAINLVANLYTSVLRLPDTLPGMVWGIDAPRIPQEVWQSMFDRFSRLPFNYYASFFQPEQLLDEKPVIADLADDLTDIYRDVRPALELYQKGHTAEALWEWKFSFNSHWGRHASSALYALHAYATYNGIKL